MLTHKLLVSVSRYEATDSACVKKALLNMAKEEAKHMSPVPLTGPLAIAVNGVYKQAQEDVLKLLEAAADG